MARFLLIHGSSHGAWCWRDVLPLLAAAGHQARALDLPSNGNDPTPPGEATLDSYAEAIVAAMEGPTVLVGHSMGGYPITAAAERAPEKVRALVYVCAYVPVPGLSMADMRRAGPRQLLTDSIIVAPDRVTMTIDPAKAAGKFYHDCPQAIADYAVPRLCPQPIAPQETPLASTARAEALPRHYVICEDDRTIPPEYQETMSAGIADVHRLPCGHSPFFAMPDRLAAILNSIADET